LSALAPAPEIVLYGTPGAWGLSSLSPFVLKLEIWLQLAGVRYTRKQGNPQRAPRGKLPYARVDGAMLSDSQEILEHLSAKLGHPLDAHLDEGARARAHLARRTLEESLYWAIVRDRWIEEPGWSAYAPVFEKLFPGPLKGALLWFVRNRQVRPMLHAQGTGRLPAEVHVANAAADLRALAGLLGEAPWLGGEQPCSADASLLAMTWSVEACPVDTPLKLALRGESKLMEHLGRGRHAIEA
jgi:glutathione S-transferase